MIKNIIIAALAIFSILAVTGYCETNSRLSKVVSSLKETRTELNDYKDYYKAAEAVLEESNPSNNNNYRDYLDAVSVIQEYEENDI